MSKSNKSIRFPIIAQREFSFLTGERRANPFGSTSRERGTIHFGNRTIVVPQSRVWLEGELEAAAEARLLRERHVCGATEMGSVCPHLS